MLREWLSYVLALLHFAIPIAVGTAIGGIVAYEWQRRRDTHVYRQVAKAVADLENLEKEIRESTSSKSSKIRFGVEE